MSKNGEKGKVTKISQKRSAGYDNMKTYKQRHVCQFFPIKLNN